MATGCDSNTPSSAAAASGAPSSQVAAIPAATVPGSTSTMNATDSKSFITTGPLVAEQQADVGAERDGRVVEIAVQIGDRVKTGQLLAKLDDRMLRAACDEQKARITAAQAEVRNRKAELESAQADLHRADVLLKEKILSQENWEVSKYKVDEDTAQVERYQSEEAAAEAELASTIVQLEQSRLVAPFAGVIGRSSVRPDQQVKAGDSLFWITAESPLRVLFTVPETMMTSFIVGKRLDLTTADYPDLHQEGRIHRVSPVVDPASGSVQVIGALDHPSPRLKPGMTMQVRLAQ
ncbi:MAG: efflux RND transporter periplasmic adaptor subunit [Acidobacteriaceae bacterium]|nr:efflux RND transporter periplasmic adaptor subunit [Acidobacteriaceae bacterium]